MYVEYDSVRDFFFLAPPAFLGAFADFLEGVLAILLFVCFRCVGAGEAALTSEAEEPLFFKRRRIVLGPKFQFLAPITCPIDLSGPVANGTILKQMHGVFCIKLLNGFSKARKIQRTLPKSHMDGRMAAPRTRMMPSTPLNAEMLKGKT